MKEVSYSDQKNLEYIKKLRELQANIPAFLKRFFIGIDQSTAPRTRVAYATDLKVFFEYIKVTNPVYKDVAIQDIKIDILSELTAQDFEEFVQYLKLYNKPSKFIDHDSIDDIDTHNRSIDTIKKSNKKSSLMDTLNKSNSINDKTNNRLISDPDNMEITNTERGIKRKLSSLRAMYHYYHKNQIITNNPILQVDMPKLHDKAIVRLDVDEIANFLDQVESGDKLSKHQQLYHEKAKIRDLALMTLMLGTGIRVSECVGLDIMDVDMNNDRIKVTRKGGYEDYVYFGDEVRVALLSYLNERENLVTISGHENALFLSSRKQRISVRNVEVLVKKYAQTVTYNKKITPHKLRSTYGTALYRETNDIYLVADVLGHKDVNTTKKHYAALEEERRMSARNAVKLRE